MSSGERELIKNLYEHDIFQAVLNVPCWIPGAWATISNYGRDFNELMLSNRAARRAYVYGQRMEDRDGKAS